MSLITWNPNVGLNDMILSNNNLTAKKGTVKIYEGTRTTEGKLKGKYYFEIAIDEMVKNYYYNDIIIGICNDKQVMTGFNSGYGFTNFFGYYDFGSKVSHGEYIKYGDAYDKGDIISVLLNLDDKNIEFWKNGISQGVAFSNLENAQYYPCVFAWTNFQWTANFGASKFKFRIPKGYISYDETQHNIRKYLIKQNNQYYTLKSEFYKNGQFIPLTLEGGTNPNVNDYNNFGFDEINALLSVANNNIINGVDKGNLGSGKYFEIELDNNIKKINNIIDNLRDLYISFSNGNRLSLIDVTCSSGLEDVGSIKNLVNGTMINDFYFKATRSNQWILFNFSERVCIQELKWKQSTKASHGAWKLQGSNDNNTFIDIGEKFTLDDGIFTFSNSDKYKYYKLQQIEGVTSGSPWIYEIEFGIKTSNNKYLIQHDNKFYIFKENNIISSPSQTLIEDNFTTNGFNDVTVITEEQWSNAFENKTDVKLLIWTDDITKTEIKVECKTNPFRPIDKFNDEFEIKMMKEA